ncbi:hypothetical protein [Novosphingobium rosa]|uniref:hypothetical protein n=1 Tax=Novosphingobium rosa TaxID=76978 RepID=UPI0008295E0C|nr:hypothetical protein [Novosphingobium rosa]
MNSILKKISLGSALALTALTGLTATPAAAQPWHGGYGYRGGGAGAAVAAGVVGLAVGAALADQGGDYDYDATPVGYAPYGGPASCYEAYPGYEGYCYPSADYYRMGWSWRDGYWWNHDGQRFAHPFIGRGGPGFAPHGGFAGGYHGGFGGGGYAPHGGGNFGGGHGGGFGGHH